VAYKNSRKWAENVIETTGNPAKLIAITDRKTIRADGKDLSFITLQVTDRKGRLVPLSDNLIEFGIEGPGEIIATDNGDPTDMMPFPSFRRKAFNGLVLIIVRSISEDEGTIKVMAKSPGLKDVTVEIKSK
jgi:beta-galactosidase